MKGALRFAAAYLSFQMLVLSVALFAGQSYRAAKGAAAGVLIERALAAHLEDGRRHRPWPWADTCPVALLEIPGRSLRRVVLAGATGASMAFAAGWLDGTAPPNGRGNCVLAGHRDRAFAFLEELRPGQSLRLTTPAATRDWEVCGAAIVSRFDAGVADPTPEARLSLVTCYPFDGLTASDLRYVVVCRPLAGPAAGRPAPASTGAPIPAAPTPPPAVPSVPTPQIPPIPRGRLLLM